MQKTQYFTEQNITVAAKAMYSKLDNQFDLHKDRLDISISALLILDMQKFFLDDSSHAFVPSAQAIITPINSLATKFRENNRPIIVTRHLNTDDNANQMDYWWRDILTEDNNYSELIPEIKNLDSEIIFKSQYDAFFNTSLIELLKAKNVEQVVITGVMTHLCCETTARSAFVHGFNVFFPIDGSATYNDIHHNASLTNLAHGFANITLIEKLIVSING